MYLSQQNRNNNITTTRNVISRALSTNGVTQTTNNILTVTQVKCMMTDQSHERSYVIRELTVPKFEKQNSDELYIRLLQKFVISVLDIFIQLYMHTYQPPDSGWHVQSCMCNIISVTFILMTFLKTRLLLRL